MTAPRNPSTGCYVRKARPQIVNGKRAVAAVLTADDIARIDAIAENLSATGAALTRSETIRCLVERQLDVMDRSPVEDMPARRPRGRKMIIGAYLWPDELTRLELYRRSLRRLRLPATKSDAIRVLLKDGLDRAAQAGRLA